INAVYAGIVGTVRFTDPVSGIVSNRGDLSGIFRSTDAGASWTAMDLPSTIELAGAPPLPTLFGLNPGNQGNVHFSIVADPLSQDVVYVGGDVDVSSPTGRLFRGDAALPSGLQWLPIVGTFAGGTAPHADSRAMVFDKNGNILEGDDG